MTPPAERVAARRVLEVGAAGVVASKARHAAVKVTVSEASLWHVLARLAGPVDASVGADAVVAVIGTGVAVAVAVELLALLVDAGVGGLGPAVGCGVGSALGCGVGMAVGCPVGRNVGASVGTNVG